MTPAAARRARQRNRRRVFGALGIAAAAGTAIIGSTFLSDAMVGMGSSDDAASPTPELIARGAYLAQLGDCAACHSVPGKPPFTGGLKMAIPIGSIYTSNITPDRDHGIGRYSLQDFDRALRFGVADGHTLYPAMPFPSYALIAPDDVQALYAYFKNGVQPAAVPNELNEVRFPFSMRWPLTIWRWLFASKPATAGRPPASGNRDPIVARGAYLVEGPGHCGDCHTPRAATLQVKALRASDGSSFLSGAVVEAWLAPSLRNGGQGSIGDWTEADLVGFLKTGTNRHGIAFGSMSDVIVHSTQGWTNADATAAARFLKTLTAEPATTFAYDNTTHRALLAGDASQRGALIYLNNCAACHRPDGKGYDGVFPSLAGNPIVESASPLSLIHIVLHGSTTPRTDSTPAQFTMPAFDWRMSDQDVADVVSFIRTAWGNHAQSVDMAAVVPVRRETTK